MPIQVEQQLYKKRFWLTIEESEQVHNHAGVDEGKRADRCFLSSVPEQLFWT